MVRRLGTTAALRRQGRTDSGHRPLERETSREKMGRQRRGQPVATDQQEPEYPYRLALRNSPNPCRLLPDARRLLEAHVRARKTAVYAGKDRRHVEPLCLGSVSREVY